MKSCECSDHWKALNWTAQGPTPHDRDCPLHPANATAGFEAPFDDKPATPPQITLTGDLADAYTEFRASAAEIERCQKALATARERGQAALQRLAALSVQTG